jgi:hypothetical protein
MNGTRGGRLAGLVLGALLLAAGEGHAGPWFGWHKADCPRPSYSPCHYWTPSLYRVNACLHGPHLSVYPPDRAPGLAPSYLINRYPCPVTDPTTFYENRARAEPRAYPITGSAVGP